MTRVMRHILNAYSMASRSLRWRRDQWGHQDRTELSDLDATWQYFLDHARPGKEGGYVFIMPLLQDKEDLFRRIKTRKQGKYRYTEKDLQRQKPVRTATSKKGLRRNLRRFLAWVITKI